MPLQIYKIASTTVTASAGVADITFSNIPQGYTDLKLVISARYDGSTAVGSHITFNGSTTGYSDRGIEGTGSTASSFSNSGGGTKAYVGVVNWSGSTSSVFASYEVYIPNYSGSSNKSFSVDQVTENNATQSWTSLMADLWSNTSAITSIRFFPGSGNLVQNTTATLYGVL